MAGILTKLIKILAISYVLFIAILYLFQEKLIFLPQKLDQNFSYKFSSNFSEIWLENGDIRLNALHFKSENPKGIVVFMHGNYGNLSQWSDLGDEFLRIGYDFLIYDYRGYGKSGGKITSESEL
ncbi:MAG: alpha/beta hydrolase [Campylobacter sp.]|nr:alpha/beta hydrolase [Campylobacter sp.]